MSINLIGDQGYIWHVLCNQSFEVAGILKTCLSLDAVKCSIRFIDMVYVKSVLCSSNISLGRSVGINESNQFMK